jgi:hypothetical protein
VHPKHNVRTADLDNACFCKVKKFDRWVLSPLRLYRSSVGWCTSKSVYVFIVAARDQLQRVPPLNISTMHDFCCLTQMHGALQPPAKARVTFLDTRPSPACQHRRHVSSRARATHRWHVYGPDVTAEAKKRQYVRAHRRKGEERARPGKSNSNRARPAVPFPQIKIGCRPAAAARGRCGPGRRTTSRPSRSRSSASCTRSLSPPIPIPPPARPPPFLLLAYGRFAIV